LEVPFAHLDAAGQRAFLRRMAESALRQFRLPKGGLRFIHNGENATFAFDASSPLRPRLPEPYHPSRLLVRLHRPGRDYARQIESETAWLAALRSSGFVVPEPVPLRDGGLVGRAEIGGHSRCVTVMRWIQGSRCKMPDGRRLYQTGRLLAQLHSHTEGWKRPRGFVRMRWTWDQFFGKSQVMIRPTEELWSLVPKQWAGMVQRVADDTRDLYPDRVPAGRPFGLVHGDLHSWNTVALRGRVYPIDFDDCGFAYHLMDVANVMDQCVAEKGFWDLAAAFMRGYREVRAFPEEEWRMVGRAMAARGASNVLWLIDKSLVNAAYRENLDEWLEEDRVALNAALEVDRVLRKGL